MKADTQAALLAAFTGHSSATGLNASFHNRKSQPDAARVSRSRTIEAIKWIENLRHRAKISAAMKKRWARASGKKTAESQSEQTKLGGGKKRTMSAAHKAQIAERMRAYWAKAKAEKKR